MTNASTLSSYTRAVQRFLRTPKGLLLLVFAVLLAVAVPLAGPRLVGPMLASAVAAAALADLPMLRWRQGRWVFPSGAILTGLIVAMVLSAHEPPSIVAWTVVIAIASKYVFRYGTANIFNPAALAIVATFYLFHTGQSWWGALSDAPALVTALLLAAGGFVAHRVNKLPMVLTFLGVYYALFTSTAFVGHPEQVAEIFRAPDLQAVLFFAFFILTDPPTSPTKFRDQCVCGALVAGVSYAVFEWLGVVYYLLAGVLIGNVWEVWRRRGLRRQRALAARGTA